MKKTYCNICKKEFTGRDNYVKGKMIITYTVYLYDDGSNFEEQDNDLCEECLKKIIKYIKELEK